MTMDNKREQIWQSLSDSGYRHQFVEEEINVGIAFQIRSLRNRQNLTQEQLAELLKGKQSLLSTWENPNYGKYSIATLKELAKAFDVGLLVRFVPFSTLVDWTINLTSNVIAPPSFAEEDKYNVALADSAAINPSTGSMKPSVSDADTLSDFVNSLVPDTFASTVVTGKELVCA